MYTGIAAIAFKSGASTIDNSIRVYFQKAGDNLYEFCCDDGKWNKGNSIGSARPNTPLAAIRTSENNTTIQLFYVSIDNTIQHVVFGHGGWRAGDPLPPTPDVADNTSLAAATWGSGAGRQIRIYYQQKNCNLQELVFSGGAWTTGIHFTDAVPGTQLAAMNSTLPSEAGFALHLFHITPYAGRTAYIRRFSSDTVGHWSAEHLDQLFQQPIPGGGLAATAWGSKADYQLRLYFPNDGGWVTESVYSSADNQWNVGRATWKLGIDVPLASVTWLNSGSRNIDVVFKDGEAAIVNQFYDGTRWEDPVPIRWDDL